MTLSILDQRYGTPLATCVNATYVPRIGETVVLNGLSYNVQTSPVVSFTETNQIVTIQVLQR